MAADVSSEAEGCLGWGLLDSLGFSLMVARLLLAAPTRTRKGESQLQAVWFFFSSEPLQQSQKPPPQKIPLTSHWPEMGHIASPYFKEGEKCCLAFQPLLRRKPEKKGTESVSWVIQPTVSGSTGEQKQ